MNYDLRRDKGPNNDISQAGLELHSINSSTARTALCSSSNITLMDTTLHISQTTVAVVPRLNSNNITQIDTALQINISAGAEDWEQWSGCCEQIVLFLVMVAVCSVLGTAGNIPVLLVYCSRTERRMCITFIKVLAIIDLLVCAVIMPYTVVMELHLVSSDIVCRLFEFLRHVSINASNLTLVAIAVERYVAVCVIRHRLTIHNVNQGLLVVMGVSVLVALPALGVFTLSTSDQVQDVACAFPHHFDRHFTFCHFNPSVMGPILTTAYQAVLMALFFITFIVIVVLYTLIHFSLWKRAKQKSGSAAFKSEADTSSCGERKKKRHLLRGESDQDQRKRPAQEELRMCLEEAGCSLEDNMNHPVACRKLNEWMNRGSDDLLSTSGCTSSSGGKVHRRISMHRRTARMLFVCTVVFLVTWLPFWVDVFSGNHNLCLRYMFFVGNASNPLVYSIANPHFRTSLVNLILALKTHCTPCKTM